MNIEELIFENKNLIYKIASKYSRYYSMEDLFQVGSLGLIKAANNYNENLGVKFSTYSYKYIIGEIINFINNDRTMKVSIDTLKIYKSYEQTKEYLTSHLNRIPSFTEICDFMEIDETIVSEAIEKSEFAISLESTLGEDDFTLEKVTGRDRRQEIDELLDLKAEIERLPYPEKEIIELRYYKDYTQSETAEELRMNQAQVSRYEKKILSKIKTNMAA